MSATAGMKAKDGTGAAPSMAGDLSPAAYEALAEFHYCVRKLLAGPKEAQSLPIMESLDVELLLSCRYYSRMGSLSLTDLRERLGLNQGSLLRLIDRAVQNRWLERRSNKRACRGVFLHLTARAEAKLAQLVQQDRDCLRTLSTILMQSLDSLMPGHGSAAADRGLATA